MILVESSPVHPGSNLGHNHSQMKKIKIWLPILALLVMGLLMVDSVKDDTVTTDENLMVGVGDLILKEQTFKVGFEPPPLMRDLVALPLLFMNLEPASHFIDNVVRQNVSDFAFYFGENFIYGQKNVPPEKILLAARVPAILLTLFLGYLLFSFCSKFYDSKTAFLALAFFISSPFFLAHGRLTTMDVPSAFFVLLCLWTLIRLLNTMTWKNAGLLGLTLAGALLTKHSMTTLLPFLIVAYFVHGFLFERALKKYGQNFLVVFAVSLTTVYLFYLYHLWNYPMSEQIADMKQTLQSTRSSIAAQMNWIVQLAHWPITRPLAHYFYGLFWQLLRPGAFGYFMGEGSMTSWLTYYPVGFFAKNPLPFLILFLAASGLAAKWLWAQTKTTALTSRSWLQQHFVDVLLLSWVLYFAFVLIFLNSGNTGSRYLIPLLPAVFILVSRTLTRAMNLLPKKILPVAGWTLAALLVLQFSSV
ncbi:MAG: hypothetical protein COT73_05160, partial [Bdellovibrio sp. CG10_big_fil_rev_8_21_14_0_10_47_8]